MEHSARPVQSTASTPAATGATHVSRAALAAVLGVSVLATGVTVLATNKEPTVAAAERSCNVLRLVVTQSPGGMADAVARSLAGAMSQRGTTTIVENRPGAAGRIGLREVAHSADHCTSAVVAGGQLSLLPQLNQPGTVPASAITPVALLASNPLLVAVRSELGVNSLEELARLSQRRTLSYVSGGVASVQHAAMELLKARYGIQASHVPVKGTSEGLNVLMQGGGAEIMVGNADLADQVSSGRVKLLGVMVQEGGTVPEQLRELGVPLLPVAASAWYGMVVSARFSDRAEWWNDQIRQVLQDPAVIQQLAKLSLTPGADGPAELEDRVASEGAAFKPYLDLLRPDK